MGIRWSKVIPALRPVDKPGAIPDDLLAGTCNGEHDLRQYA
jgi:hypothetical protein